MDINSNLRKLLPINIHLSLIIVLFLMITVNCNQASNEWKYYNDLEPSPTDLLNKLEDKRGINLGRKMMCRMDPRNCAGLLADTSPYQQRNVVYRRAEGFIHSDSDSRDSISRALESRLPILPDNGRY